ncbi:Transcription elongation factor SPT6 [Candida tropicalis]
MASEDEIERNNHEDNSQSEGEGDDLREQIVDSSEEDDDDDDEEEIQKVREGFIVDDDEDEIETRKRKKHKKRRRERSNEDRDDALDDDDLQLLLENSGLQGSRQSKFKKLKRKHVEDDKDDVVESNQQQYQNRESSGMRNMFSDDEDEEGLDEDEDRGSRARNNIVDEFDDFIEEDEFSDEDEEAQRARREQKKKMKKKGARIDTSKLSSVDRQSLQELFEVFGDGNEYDWALEAQEMEDSGNLDKEEPATLDEVFEHSELKERMLTDEDNLIRIIDVPERYQKYRSTLTYIDLEGEELEMEKNWVSDAMMRERSTPLPEGAEESYKQCVGNIIDFISKENLEVPFINTHRLDYLEYVPDYDPNNRIRLFNEDDLWRIVKLDIEYHTLYEKRLNAEKLVDSLDLDDDLIKDIKSLDTMVAVQDVHDYIQFTYSKEIREKASSQGADDSENNEDNAKSQPRKHMKVTLYERIKSNILYDAVKAYGITAKQFGENVQDQSSKGFEVPYRIHATDDSWESPEELIQRLAQDDEIMFKDEKIARDAVRKTFAEEIFHNPRIRQEVRQTYKMYTSINFVVTEKGRATIDNHSPYADIKYAINRDPVDLVTKPDVLLRMLEAEKLGLGVIVVETRDYNSWFESIFNCFKSDGSSDVSERWNKEREVVLRMAFKKLCSMVALNTKEDLRRECERLIANQVKRGLVNRIDQAPLQAFGFEFGSTANVLSITFGKGDFDSAVIGVYMRDNGKIVHTLKSNENPIRNRETEDVFKGWFLEQYDNLFRSEKPDVIVVSGFNANTKKLYDIICNIVAENKLGTSAVKDEYDDNSAPVQVIWGQDETARLYQNSERASKEFPDKPPLVKYAIALGRYVQDPLLEYVTLGDDILSLTFHPHQKLIPTDLIKESIESAFVDMVNLVGVKINDATRSTRVSQMMQYVGGLGPRKASGLLRNINSHLYGVLVNRSALIESELTSANIFINCASSLNVVVDKTITSSDYGIEVLDSTRIHPEDYDLAKKMASDALGIDEEDAMVMNQDGRGGVVRQLIKDDPEKLNSLDLVSFAQRLEERSHKKKLRTLQAIRQELINRYEEARQPFRILNNDDAFFILTGEHAYELRNTVVPITIVKISKNYNDPYGRVKGMRVITPSLIQGRIDEGQIPKNIEYQEGQVIQGVLLELYTDSFTAVLSLRKEDIKRAMAPSVQHQYGKWDFEAQDADIAKERAKENAKLAKTRNVQHPLFRNFNFRQAEEYLAPQKVGDCVIRPSSKGPQFLTITWKVAPTLFQHLLVEERSRGRSREYYVEGQRYQDLDQLIFQHIQVIAKNVSSMVHNGKFREGTMTVVNEWLESYTRANPKSSAYAFCYDHKSPGNFLLLFKINSNTKVVTWHVKTCVNGYILKTFTYPNMISLCNGFKQTVKNMSQPQTYNYGGY